MNSLIKKFEKMGARLKFDPFPVTRRWSRGRDDSGFSVDVRRDKEGPFFNVSLSDDRQQSVEVLDLQPWQRHLLLLIRDQADEGEVKHKFLCGHDERDWFAAAVPDVPGVSNVRTAMEALKPDEVLVAQARKNVKMRHRNRRRNEAFVRQGEWFFIPEADFKPIKWMIIRDEPLIRGQGKPHTAEYVYRTGGTTVYLSREYPNGLSEAEYRRLLQLGEISANGFQVRRLDPEVYVKGRITHADHKTVLLDTWHRVVPNTENRAASMKHLAFID